jgi:O-antigen ligase
MSAGSVLTILTLLANLKNTESEKKLISYFVITLGIVSLYKVYTIRSLMLLDNSSESVVTNWALIPASLFPFVFYIKVRWMRLTLLTVILAAVMLGNKRSGLIAIGLSTAMIGLYILLLRRRLIKLRYIFVLLIISFLIYLSYYLYSDLYLNSYLRIVNISEDGGSGRAYIWLEIIDFLGSASLENLILGGGSHYYHVAVNPNFSSAHNDFLELFLSYGIFGVIFYFLILIRLMYFVFVHIKARSELALFSISLFFMFVVMSNVSGVFIYHNIYIAFYIGFAILESNNRKKLIY